MNSADMNLTRLLVIWVLLLGVIGLASSCEYNTTDDLYPQPSTCDTENMSYANDIVPIMATHCLQCHNSSDVFGGVALEPHADLLQWVDNGLFLCSIKWESSCSNMPQGAAKIPPCAIAKIESWILDGALEN